MFTSQECWLYSDNGETGSPINISKKIRDADPAAENTSTVVTFSAGATSFIWGLFHPITSNIVNGPGETLAAGQQRGWDILRSEMNFSASGFTGKRFIPAGTWTFRFVVNASAADEDVGSNYQIQVYVHKRGTNNVLTELFNTTSAGFNLSLTTNTDVTWISASQSRFEFDTDQTLEIEVWIRGRGQASESRSVTLHLGNPTAGDRTSFSVPSPGVRTLALAGVSTLGSGNANGLIELDIDKIQETPAPKKIFIDLIDD